MKYRVLEWLACPACRGSDLVLEIRKTSADETYHGAWAEDELDLPGLDHEGRALLEILEGAIHCKDCSSIYLITEGIPRMILDQSEEQHASGHRWTKFHGEAPEYEENFKDMTHPLNPKDYLGKLVVDLGCGFGRHAYYAARYGAEVLCIDNASDAVISARANCEGLPRVHVIQGDMSNPPIRDECADFAFCFGVLHHLEDPRAAFGAVKQLLKTNGRLQVWVYGPRQGSVAMVSRSLHGAASGMADERLHQFSRWISSGLRLFSHTPYRVLRHTPVMKSVVSHLPAHDHHKWPFDVVVADVYDRLRVPVTAYIMGEELERWFADEGYSDIQVTRRVRNNESFRGMGTRR